MEGESRQPTILIATNNPGKLREIAALLGGLPLRLVSPADLDLQVTVDESGSSYRENAILKAAAFARASGQISVADDSGLEIAALEGWPGLHSARVAGPTVSAVELRRIVLDRLRGHAPAERRARFVCHVAVASPSGILAEGRGVLEGTIALSDAGEGGFGYDPIFIPEGRDRTLAQLSPDEKNRLSHRARAIQQLRPFFERLVRP